MTGNVPASMRRVRQASADGAPRKAIRARSGIGPWFVVPALLLLAVFVYRPLVVAVQMSLSGTNLFGQPAGFVGLRNYAELLTEPSFLRVVGTTLVIAVLSMAMAVTASLLAVLLLRRWIPGRGVFQVVFSLPFAYSAASASAVFSGMLSPSVGVVNQLLSFVGLSGPPWLSSPGWAVFSIALTTAWYEAGFSFLVLAAAVRALPPEVVEAAQLDGAGGLRMARSVLIPLMSPSLFFLVVTQTISGLQIFTQVQIMTSGGPSDSTTTLVFQLYQSAFGEGVPNYGEASVVAVLLVIVVAIITWLQFRFLNRRVTA